MRENHDAIVLGFKSFGNVSKLAHLLNGFGFQDVIAIVNRADLVDTSELVPGMRIVEVPDLLNPSSLYKAAIEFGAGDPRTPFICAIDRPMLSYLEAWRRLGAARDHVRHIPTDGIMRARIKPFARELWNLAWIDDTPWAVYSEGQVAPTSAGTLRTIGADEEYVVKPIAGVASEAVKACLGKEVQDRVAEVRAFLANLKTQFGDSTTSPETTSAVAHIGNQPRKYNIFSDVLVEKKLAGNEYTVDGYIQDGHASIAVQQKEYRIVHPFFGDGLIVSPPATSVPKADDPFSTIVSSEPCHTSIRDFEEFMERGLAALGINNWVFHAEVIETKERGLRFVELNPRPPGGLLAHTAEKCLGQDPYETLIKMHLGIPLPIRRNGWITGQFPIYAKRTGEISYIKGIEEARKIKGVVKVVQVARVGQPIESLDKENYLAFVSIYAPTHDEVRQIAARVVEIIDIG